jgi:hypothetical protein
MNTYRVPYELALKLDLTEGLFDEDLKAIEEDEFIEDVEITFTPINGYIVQAHFKYTILKHNYGHIVDYNTSSPYALYMLELEDYNDFEDYNSDDSDDSDVSNKVILPSRRSIVSSTTKLTTKKNKQNIVLHKGPDGKHYHRPSGLVFNRDKVVIGTWLKACDNPEGVDEIIPLTDKDIEKAKKHMFAFQKEETDNVTLATRKVTKFLDPEAAKNLEQSLSNAIAETNAKADDVNDILCELQTKNSDSDSCAENVSDESEYEYEDEEEELVEED